MTVLVIDEPIPVGKWPCAATLFLECKPKPGSKVHIFNLDVRSGVLFPELLAHYAEAVTVGFEAWLGYEPAFSEWGMAYRAVCPDPRGTHRDEDVAPEDWECPSCSGEPWRDLWRTGGAMGVCPPDIERMIMEMIPLVATDA